MNLQNQDISLQPRYFSNLSDSDKDEYRKLQEMFKSKVCRNNRNKRVEKFSEMLQTIKQFCIKPHDHLNNWKRFLVCGLCWIPGSNQLGVNIRQLSTLLDKCKSSINGSFLRAGYKVVPVTNTDSLVQQIPQLKDNFTELREWSMREQTTMTPTPSIPIFSQPFAVTHPFPFRSPAPQLPSPPCQEMYKMEQEKTEEFFDDPFSIPPSFLLSDSEMDNQLFDDISWL